MGIRPCYYRYLQEQGYSVKVNQDGSYKSTPLPGGQEKPIVSLSTYYNIWKRDYDYLKVCRPVEDICSLCYQFAHRAKYMSCLGVSQTTNSNNNVDDDDDEFEEAFNNLNVNSSIDDQLFRDDPPETPSPEETADAEEEVYGDSADAAAGEEAIPDNGDAAAGEEAIPDNGADREGVTPDEAAPDMRLVHMLGSPPAPYINHQDVDMADIAPVGNETALFFRDDISIIDPAAPGEDGTVPRSLFRNDDDDDDDDDEAALDPNDERREQMIMRAVMHVKRARAQRKEYQKWVKEAKDHARRNVAHKDRIYCGVVDFGQNMQLPLYNQEQPGTSYYYSPLNVYNLGFVDHAYRYDDGTITEHMLAHLYHEGIGKKGANNVCSLVMKSMKHLGWIKFDENGEPITGGHLILNFDNCTGQNKNNVMMKLIPFLYETKAFSKITFNFLVVGHTKNAADRLFNTLNRLKYPSQFLPAIWLQASLSQRLPIILTCNQIAGKKCTIPTYVV
jgi:hypothetical protein